VVKIVATNMVLFISLKCIENGFQSAIKNAVLITSCKLGAYNLLLSRRFLLTTLICCLQSETGAVRKSTKLLEILEKKSADPIWIFEKILLDEHWPDLANCLRFGNPDVQ